MTPANPDALAEARDLIRQSLKVGAPGLSEAAREAVVRSITLKLEGKVFAPLLAALQQQAASISSLEESVNSLEADLQRVTAERDEAREEAYDLKLAAAGGEDMPGSASLVTANDVRHWREKETHALRTAEARAAQLQAEVEAKDRRIALTNRVQAQLEVAQNALCKIDRGGKPMRDIAAQALLRIAMVPYPEEAAALARSAKEERTNA